MSAKGGFFEVYSSIGSQSSAELALVQAMGSRVPSALHTQKFLPPRARSQENKICEEYMIQNTRLSFVFCINLKSSFVLKIRLFSNRWHGGGDWFVVAVNVNIMGIFLNVMNLTAFFLSFFIIVIFISLFYQRPTPLLVEWGNPAFHPPRSQGPFSTSRKQREDPGNEVSVLLAFRTYAHRNGL